MRRRNEDDMETPLFSKVDIRRLILPLIIEQFLAVLVGMADTVMVASVGEAAVSGISLVDSLNILIINIFSALATGGAVAAAHYLGEGNRKKACDAADQLMLVVGGLALIASVISLTFNYGLLHSIYGNLDAEVMGNARIYFYLTAASFPFLAIYNGSAAICRSMGNSKISMKVSVIMNGINVSGNALLIYGMEMGVAGAGIATLVSRMIAAVIMFMVVRDPHLTLHISRRFKLRPDFSMIREILHIGVPNGIETGVFQGGKLMVAGLVASFGTTSIAANAVANTLASFQVIPGSAVSLALITLVGQAVGAKRYDEAKRYTWRMMGVVTFAHVAMNLPILLGLRHIIAIYNLQPDTAELAWKLAALHSVFCIVIWGFSFCLPSALRAADDAGYTMTVTVASLFFCRILLSYVFGRYLGMGVTGVWVAMICDWVIRSVFFIWRIASGHWLKNHHRREAANQA